MTVETRVVDRALREDFGFENLLWGFSGRRGILCWVCDDEALVMTNEARSAVASYLTVYVGNENTGNTARISTPMHPSLQKASDIIK